VVESKHEALSSNSSIEKKKQAKDNRKDALRASQQLAIPHQSQALGVKGMKE
jgi:hypothetical protein